MLTNLFVIFLKECLCAHQACIYFDQKSSKKKKTVVL